MNPRGGEQTNIEPVSYEQYGGTEETAGEAPVSSPESSPAKQPPPPPVTSIVVPDQPAVVIPAQADNDGGQVHPLSTSDHKDKIEREWLDRAKKVIAEAKDDPFKQKNEMSKVKAQYIEKKYNKKIKVDDTVAQ